MAESEPEKERKRSPNYPSASLRVAVEKIRMLYKEDKGAATAPEIMAKHWNTSIKSSSFLQTVGALRKYGLIADIDGPNKKMKLTNTAMEIVMLPETDPKHVAALKRAALKPKLFNDLWAQYGPNLPSDDTLAHELVSAQNFLVDTAIDVIKQYKKNIEFAKLSEVDKMSDSHGSARPGIDDFVQWRSQGVDQFKEPQKVVGISDDGLFLFVEDQPCGIPADQTFSVSSTMQESTHTFNSDPPAGRSSSASVPQNLPPNPKYKAATAMKQDVFTTDGGEVIVRWPAVLSEEDFNDMVGWLDMLKRKIQRSIRSDNSNSPYGPAKIEMNPR